MLRAIRQWTEANGSRGVGVGLGGVGGALQGIEQINSCLCHPVPLYQPGRKPTELGGSGVFTAVEDTEIYTCRFVSF